MLRLFLVIAIAIATALRHMISAQAANASVCNRTCGGSDKVVVPYPFGFTAGCPIRLDCSDVGNGESEVQIGGFLVRNVTSESLLVDVPPVCGRPIRPVIHSLFGPNYAMTWKNVLLVTDCSSPVSGCNILTDLLSQRFDLGSCGPKSENVSCLSGSGGATTGFLNATNIIASGCASLFTFIGYENGQKPYLPSLTFRTVELGWWLEGECLCSPGPGANCTNVTSPLTGKPGYRCSCVNGFQGDGFQNGDGCRRATAPSCNPSKYLSGSCGGGSTSRVALLIGGIVAGASVMGGLGLACCFIRRRSSYSKVRRGTKRLLSQASCTVPLYTYKDIERATSGFADSQRLGTGAYGTVYSGKINNDKLVAIKKIKHRDSEGIEQVMNEIKLLSSVSHPNLVRLLGCCIEREEQILVYEFMPNGTLGQHLQRERGPALPWTVRLTVATETARAIAYLHSAIHPPIYHRDIKSSNILLDYNFNSKVADFGLSRIGMADSSHISTAPQGTPGYLDPQYHQNFHLSDKSDVYSFGVVLVEIITALKVVDFNREQSEVNLAALAIDKIGKGCVDEIVDPYLDPHRDAWTLSSIHKVAELAFRCLAFHRDMRPSMMEVADELEQIKLSGWSSTTEDVFMSPASSLYSATSNGTDRSQGQGASKNKRLITANTVMADVKVADSPVSVQDPWFSEQSSPSSNSLLGKPTHTHTHTHTRRSDSSRGTS